MVDAVTRFSGFADEYDRARPSPPPVLVDVLRQWAGTDAPRVVDLGAGTGLSTVIWAGSAGSVTAVEPSADMRAVLRSRAGDLTVVDGTAEATGLPDGCADIVTAGQAMHWFDPSRALPEVVRLLRPGGVFAAYDCDWPPCVHPEVDAAYARFERLQWTYQVRRGLRPRHADKEGHLGRMADSGLFRYVREICLHGTESGDADRLLAVAHSQGGTVALLADGMTEDELGLAELREIARRYLAEPVPWWWTYRVRLGVK